MKLIGDVYDATVVLQPSCTIVATVPYGEAIYHKKTAFRAIV